MIAPLTEAMPLLLHNIVLIFGVMILLWLVAVAIKDVSFIDAVWPMGMVLLAAVTFWLANAASPVSALLLMLTALWGLRLGLHLFVRWRRNGVDPRYAKIMASAKEKKGWSFAKTALLQVFLLQGPLLFMVCLPAQLGIWRGGTVDALALLGAVIALIGIAFETIGDWQLERFRAEPCQQGQGAEHRPVALHTPPQLLWRCLHVVGNLDRGAVHRLGRRACQPDRAGVPQLHAGQMERCGDAGARPEEDAPRICRLYRAHVLVLSDATKKAVILSLWGISGA